MATETQKKASKNWARTHKEYVNEKNKAWRIANRDKWSKISVGYRKRKAEELKAKGMMFVYLPRTERELRTIKYLCKQLNINEDESRRLLIDNDWNIKKILNN